MSYDHKNCYEKCKEQLCNDKDCNECYLLKIKLYLIINVILNFY